MGAFDQISAKDIILFLFGLGGAWMFVKMSIKALKDEIASIKIESREQNLEIKSIKEKSNKLETNVAVILEKIDGLYTLIESKTK